MCSKLKCWTHMLFSSLSIIVTRSWKNNASSRKYESTIQGGEILNEEIRESLKSKTHMKFVIQIGNQGHRSVCELPCWLVPCILKCSEVLRGRLSSIFLRMLMGSVLHRKTAWLLWPQGCLLSQLRFESRMHNSHQRVFNI